MGVLAFRPDCSLRTIHSESIWLYDLLLVFRSGNRVNECVMLI
jgi:hypothetical protein